VSTISRFHCRLIFFDHLTCKSLHGTLLKLPYNPVTLCPPSVLPFKGKSINNALEQQCEQSIPSHSIPLRRSTTPGATPYVPIREQRDLLRKRVISKPSFQSHCIPIRVPVVPPRYAKASPSIILNLHLCTLQGHSKVTL
jgi:hypothetical protein